MAHPLIRNGRKIVAIGRNFAAHAKELNNPIPSEPIIFLKPTSSYITEGQSIEVPPTTGEVHHEVELGVVMGDTPRDVRPEDAMKYVKGYVLTLDMTARNIQSAAKKQGKPWSVSKGYDTFCPISRMITPEELGNPGDTELWLKVDGKLRQKGSTKLMLFPIPNLISTVSSIMTLQEDDCILTGT